MANMLQTAAAWLTRMAKSHAGQAITYRRGVSSVALTATVGKTDFVEEDSTRVATIHTARDYLIATADLVLGGSKAVPLPGDRIEETDNGSTLSLGTNAVARLVGMQYKVGGNTIDVTEPEDLNKLFEVGQDDLELTAKVKRMPTATRGSKSTVTVTWADGSTTTLPGTWVVTAVDGGGDQDNPIAGSITLKPTVPEP